MDTLKKIQVDQLQLGMHLHALCGPWLDHPFWKTRFVLSDAHDLDQLRNSGVSECWIDVTKGLDVEVSTHAVGPSSAPAQPLAAAPAVIDRQQPARASVEDESVRAVALLKSAKAAVQALFDDARMGRALGIETYLPLVDDIASSVWRNSSALLGLARLKSHDEYTFMHSVAACALMVSLAQQLGHDEAQVRAAGMAGLLHDVGKALMPLEVLNKPGPLNEAEFALIRTHPRRGHELLAGVMASNAIALDVCLHHHERPDGKGYPDALVAAQLSLPARMGAVCDVYDAITSNRPYKAGWDPAASIARMAEWTQQGQFDPEVFQAFVHCLGIYPVGSLLRLRSGRLAVVAEHNASSLVSPRVRVFFSTKSGMPIPVETIDLSRPGCEEKIVARESNDRWAFPYLDKLATGHDAASVRAPIPVAGRAPLMV